MKHLILKGLNLVPLGSFNSNMLLFSFCVLAITSIHVSSPNLDNISDPLPECVKSLKTLKVCWLEQHIVTFKMLCFLKRSILFV